MRVVRGIGGEEIVHVDRISVTGCAQLEIGDPLEKSVFFKKGRPVYQSHILVLRDPDVRILVHFDVHHDGSSFP